VAWLSVYIRRNVGGQIGKGKIEKIWGKRKSFKAVFFNGEVGKRRREIVQSFAEIV
jgi:hypothetical protein